MRQTQKSAKKACDTLFSQIIRSYGHCEACGSTLWLQCCHINSRKYSATRTDFRNAFCACAKCHRYWHDFPREFSHFISDSSVAEYYDEVFAKSREATKVDWIVRLQELKDIQKQDISLGELRKKDSLYSCPGVLRYQ
jgi:hypothetical protein